MKNNLQARHDFTPIYAIFFEKWGIASGMQAARRKKRRNQCVLRLYRATGNKIIPAKYIY